MQTPEGNLKANTWGVRYFSQDVGARSRNTGARRGGLRARNPALLRAVLETGQGSSSRKEEEQPSSTEPISQQHHCPINHRERRRRPIIIFGVSFFLPFLLTFLYTLSICHPRVLMRSSSRSPYLVLVSSRSRNRSKKHGGWGGRRASSNMNPNRIAISRSTWAMMSALGRGRLSWACHRTERQFCSSRGRPQRILALDRALLAQCLLRRGGLENCLLYGDTERSWNWNKT